MSLSIADAKVDTFQLLAKQSRDFFSEKFKLFLQYTDFQHIRKILNFLINYNNAK